MTIYKIIPNADGTGFNIGIAGSDGARQTMLGFETEAEAEAWIIQDKRLNDMPKQHATATEASAFG